MAEAVSGKVTLPNVAPLKPRNHLEPIMFPPSAFCLGFLLVVLSSSDPLKAAICLAEVLRVAVPIYIRVFYLVERKSI